MLRRFSVYHSTGIRLFLCFKRKTKIKQKGNKTEEGVKEGNTLKLFEIGFYKESKRKNSWLLPTNHLLMIASHWILDKY